MNICIVCKGNETENVICEYCKAVNVEYEIGYCSELISIATRLHNPTLRNQIMKHVGDYRQKIRMVVDE
jgi:hypothetical protein